MTPSPSKRKSDLFNVSLVLGLTALVLIFFALLNALGLMGKTGRIYVSIILGSIGIVIWTKELMDREK